MDALGKQHHSQGNKTQRRFAHRRTTLPEFLEKNHQSKTENEIDKYQSTCGAWDLIPDCRESQDHFADLTPHCCEVYQDYIKSHTCIKNIGLSTVP